MDTIRINPNYDFGADKQTWLFLQEQIHFLQGLAGIVGDNFILSGVTGSATISDGTVVISGEVLRFKGGAKQSKISIHESSEAAKYAVDLNNDGEYDELPTYFTREVRFGSGGSDVMNFSDLRSFKTLLDLQKETTPVGGIIMWAGSTNALPFGWHLCDGRNGTPDLRDRFIVGAGGKYNAGAKGGAESVALTEEQMPRHEHPATASQDGEHAHTGKTNKAGVHRHKTKQIKLYSGNEGGYDGGGHRVDTDGTTSYTSYEGEHEHGLDINENGLHTHDITVGEVGESEAHENRPPFYALALIMYKGG